MPRASGAGDMGIGGERMNDQNRVGQVGVGRTPRLVGKSRPWKCRTRLKREVTQLGELPISGMIAIAPRARHGRRTEGANGPLGHKGRGNSLFRRLPIHSSPSLSRPTTCGVGPKGTDPARREELLGFARRSETSVEVSDDVIDVLESDREANKTGCDTRAQLLFWGELRVRRRRGVDDE
ncbi:unannotated protein [freshwater metagenome]|uniref:Unannotated protein n=1 Tax=freshwater metagenome TaxID=449393 RepID=A0A6J7CDP1_9ZZZZ